jgi:hypothetical protein
VLRFDEDVGLDKPGSGGYKKDYYLGLFIFQSCISLFTLVARDTASSRLFPAYYIFRLIPARIYLTRGEENLWWHAI